MSTETLPQSPATEPPAAKVAAPKKRGRPRREKPAVEVVVKPSPRKELPAPAPVVPMAEQGVVMPLTLSARIIALGPDDERSVYGQTHKVLIGPYEFSHCGKRPPHNPKAGPQPPTVAEVNHMLESLQQQHDDYAVPGKED